MKTSGLLENRVSGIRSNNREPLPERYPSKTALP